MMRLNYDRMRTNNAMTHVLVLGAEGRMNEWFKRVAMANPRHW